VQQVPIGFWLKQKKKNNKIFKLQLLTLLTLVAICLFFLVHSFKLFLPWMDALGHKSVNGGGGKRGGEFLKIIIVKYSYKLKQWVCVSTHCGLAIYIY
jgi:hypothetical protein